MTTLPISHVVRRNYITAGQHTNTWHDADCACFSPVAQALPAYLWPSVGRRRAYQLLRALARSSHWWNRRLYPLQIQRQAVADLEGIDAATKSKTGQSFMEPWL